MVRRLGHKPWFAAVGRHTAPAVDRLVHRLTGGKHTLAGRTLPTLMLVHTGRRSRTIHRTPLAYVREGDGYVIAASNWGGERHPEWSANLLATPDAQAWIDGEVLDVRARLVTDDDEKARVWSKLVEIWPAYDTYVDRSGRDIRVFILEPR